ncbi:MAG: putative zinc-binding metallopeptidase [Prevotellaceae bacterium]|jgi:substrate import-associated zinc metallohydrolase lipoprotein|nr:putative zinc-binding metallopeptidase [Prevotellaceae bacterium]
MKRIALLMILFAALAACDKDELNPDNVLLGMGGDTWERTEFDDWLYEEFVLPYNIDVKYKWDPFEVNLKNNYAPVDEARARALMYAIKKVWIEPYEKKGGPDIIKRASPKRYVLVGSYEYSSTGQRTLGTAEGTNKITLFHVNTFDPSDAGSTKDRLKTVHHEYGHTLAATILFPEEWKSVGKEFYTGSWQSLSDAAALQAGFVSAYARANPDEDWAETISTILVEGREWFNKRVADAGEEGGARLRAKESILVGYLKSNWKIDLYETSPGAQDGLMDAVQEAIKKLEEESLKEQEAAAAAAANRELSGAGAQPLFYKSQLRATHGFLPIACY